MTNTDYWLDNTLFTKDEEVAKAVAYVTKVHDKSGCGMF
jgi:hypothetical protein